MTETPPRWLQRLANYRLAYQQLASAVQQAADRPLSDLEQQGLIQGFEYTHELAWNVMKDFLVWQGNNRITGSRDATREAFQLGLLGDGERWMEMISSRTQTSHTYNKAVADAVALSITRDYFPLFTQFLTRMNELAAQAERNA